MTTGLAFGALAIPEDAAAGHSALVFEDTVIGLAAFALGFALVWLARAVRARRRASREPKDRTVTTCAAPR
jgi:beta-phosphoglucomutase-like phosphatase (HAD superfamily)